jgi:hypothetical protein
MELPIAAVIVYAGLAASAIIVLSRSEAGVAPRGVLTPLLITFAMALVVRSDLFGLKKTDAIVAQTFEPGAAAPKTEEPGSAPISPHVGVAADDDLARQIIPASGGDVTAILIGPTHSLGDLEWALQRRGDELHCGRITLGGGAREEQLALARQLIARAIMLSQKTGSLACG